MSMELPRDKSSRYCEMRPPFGEIGVDVLKIDLDQKLKESYFIV